MRTLVFVNCSLCGQGPRLMRTGITCVVTRLFIPGNVPFAVIDRKNDTERYPMV